MTFAIEGKGQVGSVLFSAKELDSRQDELAKQLNEEYADVKELVLVGMLKGSFMVLSELSKRLNIPVSIDFFGASSYGDSTESSGNIHITKDLDHDISGKNVLLVEDIADTGRTLSKVVTFLKKKKTCNI